MPQAKSKNKVGLGNSLMNDRFGRGGRTSQHKASHGITRVAQDGTEYKINDKEEAAWVKMRSVTEQGDLDEFLANAELAGTDFTAERITGTKILHVDQKNPYLLTVNEERAVAKKHNENRGALTVPRRPPWNETTTPRQLDEMERESLVDWRRGLADLQENKDLLMTPFERNIEVWRQLWRVSERSDLVVQIVDARNPLLYRSEDLEKYVKELDGRKENLLLVNKADMLTLEQREAWADYFEHNDIRYEFFSARLARESAESSDGEEDSVGDLIVSKREAIDKDTIGKKKELQINTVREEYTDRAASDGEVDQLSEEEEDMSKLRRTRIMTVDELEELFLDNAPSATADTGSDSRLSKITIGLVGYPNVGKSSTINALVGAKKVSVSSTPGKTKHFQTIHLSNKVVLCDCPGLVFPNFATTKAELVVNGVLPIDQQREFTGPAGLVAQRIPRPFLESLYGIKIRTRPVEEGGTGYPTANEVLTAYAKVRGFSAQNKSGWDTSRAARVVLKDYVNGKLLWCTPPPRDPSWDDKEFNRRLYDSSRLPEKRQMQLVAEISRHKIGPHNDNEANSIDLSNEAALPGSKSKRLDKTFFESERGNSGHMNMPFNHKYTEQGKQLSGRKAKTLMAIEGGIDPSELGKTGKKHFKGNKRLKDRQKVDSNEYD